MEPAIARILLPRTPHSELPRPAEEEASARVSELYKKPSVMFNSQVRARMKFPASNAQKNKEEQDVNLRVLFISAEHVFPCPVQVPVESC